MIGAIRNDWHTVAFSAGLILANTIAHLVFDAGPAWVIWCALTLAALFFRLFTLYAQSRTNVASAVSSTTIQRF